MLGWNETSTMTTSNYVEGEATYTELEGALAFAFQNSCRFVTDHSINLFCFAGNSPNVKIPSGFH